MKHTFTFFLFFTIAILLNSTQLRAKEKEIFKNEIFAIHPNVGLTTNWHFANFSSFEGAADCGVFKKGFSTGLSGSILGEMPISESSHICLGLGYINRNAELINNAAYPTRDSSSGSVVSLNTENSLWADLGYIEIMPEIRTLIPNDFVPLRLVGGLRLGIPTLARFTQKEKALNDKVTFNVDGKRVKERIIASGEITTINSPAYGVSLGMETLLRTGETSFLTQQFILDYNLTDVAKDVSWKALSLRIELGFRFGFNRSQEEMPAPPPPPAPMPKPEPPAATVEIAENKPVIKVPSLKCRLESIEGVINTGEEFLASLPLVNCVFFDRNSLVIRDYYVTKAGDSVSYFYGNPVDMHKYILLHISGIVKNNPNARITLMGATSGKENEEGGTVLARSRAESVREALTRLGVEPGKIQAKYNEMPAVPSNQDYREGVAENQRVDIILQNAPLQEYVSVQKFAEFEGQAKASVDFENADTVPVLRTNINSQAQECSNGGIYSIPLKKRLGKPGEELPMSVTLASGSHETSDSRSFSTAGMKINPVELNLSAFDAVIRFDYNSSKLSEENKSLLKQMADFLPKGSEIIIYGSTDALGTEKRNVQLAGERARNTEEFIKSVSKGKFIIRTDVSSDKFPEDTPQGRFLNRSIRVRVGRIKN